MTEFSKYHGLGNDFLIVFDQKVDKDLAIKMCDRHFGAGADGVIEVRPDIAADFSFALHNADGSTAEVSGNGLRCVGKFLYEKGLHSDTSIKVESGAEVHSLELVVEESKVKAVTVDMGFPAPGGEIELHGVRWTRIGLGNPHAVTFVDDVNAAPVTELGPLVENDKSFPFRTNVEFVQVDGDSLHVRFWERGVGVTLASGSGSCAAVAASGLEKATVHTLGGDLQIETGPAGSLLMTGPAVHVFDGVWAGDL